jgi:hypothetical protein
VAQPYHAFRQRFDEAVPPWPRESLAALVARGAGWDEVQAVAAAVAPLGLFTFWRSEQASLMRLAGAGWECTSYLVGNSVIAERMYHADPAVMSALPFHLAITVGQDGATRLTLDQPSSHLTSFDGSAFAANAVRVDAKFAQLLKTVGAPVPSELLPPA